MKNDKYNVVTNTKDEDRPMIYRIASRIWLVFFLMLAGCGGISAPGGKGWVARPEFTVIDEPIYEIRIHPQKGAAPYYTFFQLTIVNKSDTDLILDWNESSYAYNGRSQGPLVFEGIAPSAINTRTIPPETIAPGTRFSRSIFPLSLIAWSPVKEKSNRLKGITAGMLPIGTSSINIVLRHQDRQFTVAGSFDIDRVGAL